MKTASFYNFVLAHLQTYSARKCLHGALCLILVILFAKCDVTTDEDTEPLRFETAPSSSLQTAIEDGQSAFPWDRFNQEMVVSGPVTWSRSTVIRIDAFRLRNDEVVRDTSTETVEVNGEELSSGTTTGELFSGKRWIPGQEWGRATVVRIDDGGPSWTPDTLENPSQEAMVNLVRSQTTLGPDESIVTVYPVLPPEANPLKEQPVRVKPYGVIFKE